jgi:DNA-binding MarR family transcriptional regulator
MAALRSFRAIYGSVRHYFRSVEQSCGVSGSQLWILQEVGRDAGIGVSELAGRLGIHQSTCSLLVEKLAKARHLTRSRIQRDQRRVGLKLTRKGRATLACAPGPAAGVLPRAIEKLSDATLRSLNRSLLRVVERLEVDVRSAHRPLSEL